MNPDRRKHFRPSRIGAFTGALWTAAVLGVPPIAAANPADVAALVDIGDGRAIFVECRGTGSPTVVLMAGKGNGADDWWQILAPGDPEHDAPGDGLPFGFGDLIHSGDAVLPSTARFTRVCAYDRPDVRWEGADISTPRPQPHPVDVDVDDLHALLTALGEPAPYVLVAHSYSGLIANLYARLHPENVGALVMVDAVGEQMANVVSPARLANWDAANATTTPQVREGVLLIDAFDRINAAPPLPAVPAVVLSADKPWRIDLLPASATQGEQVTFADWLAAQDQLAKALGAGHITDTHSGHDIYLYSPALVVAAIRDMVARLHG
ncbi:alpha/beta hydrolase [Mycolicibacterium goodii]|uniref:Alpha/beta hydrolase n=1 Tax=Mycolicibacterium goodii TaxID=134601 RepID=A0A0K0XE23_MYCGD|nr:alpha/beta hydrolase [Mycolicibacterium goodii]